MGSGFVGIESNFGMFGMDPYGPLQAPLGAHRGRSPFCLIFQVLALAPFPGTFRGGPCEQPLPLEQIDTGI